MDDNKFTKIRFAFAVSNNNDFEKKHFGDADKYVIYELDSDRLKLISEEINTFKNLDEDVAHGSKKKGQAIIQLLKEKSVKVLVSQQFGKNIKIVSNHFIPIIISSERADEVVQILSKHLHWIIDELKNKTSAYSLFTIKSGIMKSSIKRK